MASETSKKGQKLRRNSKFYGKKYTAHNFAKFKKLKTYKGT